MESFEGLFLGTSERRTAIGIKKKRSESQIDTPICCLSNDVIHPIYVNISDNGETLQLYAVDKNIFVTASHTRISSVLQVM